LECEIACDEIVVGETQDPARYAALLYEFAQNIVVGRPHLVWSGFVHPSGLVVRIKNVLLERDARRRTLPVPVLVILIGALLTGVGVAAFNAPALGRAANDGSLRLRAVDLRFELENGAAARRVRDFVPCGVRGGSHARTAPGTGRHREVCEDTSGRSARMTTRVAPDTTIR
jgi:hypothetical protein